MTPTLIFLHGGPGFKDYLRPFFQDLESKCSCLFYDQIRGPQVKLEDLLLQLNNVLDSAPGKRVLIGHSWGGILALEYASRHPGKLDGLVLMSTGLSHRHFHDEFKAERARQGLTNGNRDDIFLSSNERADWTTFLQQTWETFSEDTFNALTASYLKDFDVTPHLRECKMPIINIFGELDVRFPARIGRTFKNENSRLTNFEIEGAGHFPFLRQDKRREICMIIAKTFL